MIAVLLPFWSSLLVRTFAWQVILRDTGILNRFLLGLGVISEPLSLIRTTGAVIIGMSHILLPFMVLPLWAVMRRIDPEYGRAAANLGASPMRSFFRIVVPLIRAGGRSTNAVEPPRSRRFTDRARRRAATASASAAR